MSSSPRNSKYSILPVKPPGTPFSHILPDPTKIPGRILHRGKLEVRSAVGYERNDLRREGRWLHSYGLCGILSIRLFQFTAKTQSTQRKTKNRRMKPQGAWGEKGGYGQNLSSDVGARRAVPKNQIVFPPV